MIQLVDVRRVYHKAGQAVRAVDGVSLTIARGSMVTITGPSGSGKSTLMNIMGLLDRPDSGEYRFDGQEVAQLSPGEQAAIRNERIGFVFQMFHLMPRTTALENVELPLIYSDRTDRRGLGMRALERVGLADRAHHLPNELSGGQQQRVALARALVLGPDMILADEPTGNLDSKSGGEVMEILSSLNDGGATVVVITHDAEIARYADREVRIVNGRIARDTPARTGVVGGGLPS